ncbi:hypothetical protein BH09VER1_BH09VER1_42640 [soil metagenome]
MFPNFGRMTSTTLPGCSEAQRAVLGIVTTEPAAFRVCDELGIDDGHFQGAEQELWKLIVGCEAQSVPYDYLNIAQRLPEYLQNLLTACVCLRTVPALLRDYCRTLIDTRERREAYLFASRLSEASGLAGDGWRSVLDEMHAVQVSPCGLPQPVDAVSWMEQPPEVPEELIEGLLHRQCKMVLGGGSKSFKTWTLLQMALAVATGTEFWGHPCVQGRVLFVNLEIPGGFFAQRLREIREAAGLTLEPGQLDVLNLRGLGADVAVLLPRIGRLAMKAGYVLIILDPLYKLLGGRDENASTDMADLMNCIERLCVTTSASVAFGSHFAKGNAAAKESMDRISGSGVFARDPDTILTMTRHEKDDAFTVELTLRNHPPQEPFVVRRQHPLMVVAPTLDPGKLKQRKNRPRTVSDDDVLAILGDHSLGYMEWSRRVEELLGTSRETFRRVFNALREDQRIKLSAVDQKYYRCAPLAPGTRRWD